VDGARGDGERPRRVERAAAVSKHSEQGGEERAGPGGQDGEQLAQAAAVSGRQSERRADGQASDEQTARAAAATSDHKDNVTGSYGQIRHFPCQLNEKELKIS
jgi:hypothetical protein